MKKDCNKCAKTECTTKKVMWALVIIGALNWLLVGLFKLNIVEVLFGNIGWLERVIYILVGLSGVGMLFNCPCGTCKDGSCCKGTCDADISVEEEKDADSSSEEEEKEA